MTEIINIALIGCGKWGKHLSNIIEKMTVMTIKYTINNRFGNIEPILNDDSIKGVIITTQPSEHFKAAEPFLKKGLKVFIEKPLCDNQEDLNKFVKYEHLLMVGNKMVYSKSIQQFHKCLKRNNIKINHISSRWLKQCGTSSPGIFLDIIYHHLYLINYFVGYLPKRTINNLTNRYKDIPSTGSIFMKYSDNMCGFIEASYNNHEDFYTNHIRLETDRGTFLIVEEKRKISVYMDNAKEPLYKENEETDSPNEMKAFYNWLKDDITPIIKSKEHFTLIDILIFPTK